ncbi:MAG: hypothetical protein CL940_08020 [Deltaproteobacteria bacterium]|nr:hypothetical protein [Deltaproteobacteria bacterium]
MNLTNSIRWLIPALALLLLGSCGDEQIIAVGGGPTPDAQVTTSDGVTQTPAPVNAKREIVLLHDSSKPLALVVTDQVLIRAKVIDYELGGPANDVAVSYKVVDQTAEGDGSLAASQAISGGSGEVAVWFKAGLTPTVTYRVELSAENASPVIIEVQVSDTPIGDLAVNLSYEGPIAVKNVQVRLFHGSYTCGQFNPINVPEEVLGEKTLLGLGTNEEILFSDLPDGEKYTIVATAQSPSGSLAAAGCIDGVLVIAEEVNTVTLTMYLLTLNPAGTYDTVNVFDFTGAIPGQVGDVVDQIVLLFNDPGQFLLNQIKALTKNFIPAWVVDTAFGLFEDELASIISDWMLTKSPDWIQDIFIVGNDLTQVVDNLEMLATLQLSKLSNDYYIQGVLLWDGIVLYWTYGCPGEGEDGYDPDCGKFTFSIEAFINTEFPMDVVEGKFTGIIQDFDQFDIDNHVIKLNYGKLVIFVLNELLLPALSGENNLTDAMISFINCSGIASAFSNGVLDAIGATEANIEGFCEDAITLIVTPVEIILANLALDSQLRLQGHATLIDESQNLIVDHIIDGIYVGHVEVDGQEGPEFDGFWEAHRIDP